MSRYYVGLDDGYFSLSSKRRGFKHSTVLVSVIVDHTLRPIYTSSRIVHVDALDAMNAASSLALEALDVVGRVDLVLLDGVTYAGFNIVDPRRLFALHSIPVATVFRHELDLDKIYRALRNHFSDWRYRFEVVKSVYERSSTMRFPNNTAIRVACFGKPLRSCLAEIRNITVWYPNPEPLRLADIMASAIGKKLFELQRKSESGDECTPFPRPRRNEESGQG